MRYELKKSKSNLVAIFSFLLMVELIFIWSIDIAVSAIGMGGMMYNGFMYINPYIPYHISLYGLLFCFGVHIFMFVHLLFKGE